MPRKFIVSDLHGNGNIYDSIFGYLKNIEEDFILYINGDLIDRGPDSARMLLDIKKRIQDNENIVYLGGNHELMMYQVFKNRKKHKSNCNTWYNNGGYITEDKLWELSDYNVNKVLEASDFVSELNIYQLFEEKIDNKPIVLVHAACPCDIKTDCNLKIKDDNDLVYTYVWTRGTDYFINFKNIIGNKKYFTIVGHTPVNDINGYKYYKKDNYLNIDGGCAAYVYGYLDYNHSPLVEVCDGYLKILTFNNNNEIINGNYFIDSRSVPFSDEELENEKKYLNKNIKLKKLMK